MTQWELAKCVGKTNLFYSEQEVSIKFSKQLCEDCPIISECLDYALVNGEAWGVWGGLTFQERRVLAASRGLPPPSRREVTHGTEAGFAWHRRKTTLDPSHETCIPCRLAYNAKQKERQADYRKRKELK